MVYTTPEGISVLDLKTDAARSVVNGNVPIIVTGHKTQNVYYTKDGAVFATDVDSGVTREIAKLPARGSVVTVNGDETLLAGTTTEGAAPPTNRPSAGGRGGPQQLELGLPRDREAQLDARLSARIPMTIFNIDTRTGEQKTIHRATDWLNHLEFSPTDPSLLMFCHEGPPAHHVDGDLRPRVLEFGRQ
ncbi:MAG TPA: hypothetical protein VNV86_20490, partial [Candidatus Acidoferrum sp.]|nr:hypothetical protein [Candidatus Acidoferrum sp.]